MYAIKSRTRVLARHAALDVLSRRYQVGQLLEPALSTPRIHFPYLHAVPRNEEDSFRSLLAKLSETHTFISYSEAVLRLMKGQIDEPYIAFSFDDGFQSNTRTSRILEEFGATGMFFVPPDFIGTPTVRAARNFYGYSEGVDEPAMTWQDLEDLQARGHEIGNHTRTHRVLSWTNDEIMHEEIHKGAEILRQRLGPTPHFAWPRGQFKHFTPNAANEVFKAGHVSCASAERGAHSVSHDGPREHLCLRRDHIMTTWPLHHSLYFLARSSRYAGLQTNQWPKGWNDL